MPIEGEVAEVGARVVEYHHDGVDWDSYAHHDGPRSSCFVLSTLGGYYDKPEGSKGTVTEGFSGRHRVTVTERGKHSDSDSETLGHGM